MSDIATKETLDSQEAIRNETSSSDSEKALSTHQVEKVEEHSEYDLPPDPDAQLSPEEKAKIDRALIWKLDLRIMPWLCLLYLLAFLDRTNIGNAKIDGLQASLHNMTGGMYNATLSIFFVSYAIFEPAANVALKRYRPSVFIPLIMVIWGLTMTFMGFVTNWSGLMAARWFLGLAEAGLFPGVNYYLSCWYKRDEFGIRAAIFFSAAAVSGSFGGLLAAAIEKMDGLGGKPGWAWIFILEGILTVVLGAISVFFVYDFPDEATFLSEDDRRRVIRRLKVDKQASADHESFKMKYFWQSIRDWKTWLTMVVYMGADMPLYAFSLFLPTIIKDLGFASTRAQLLTVPVYVGAAISTITIGYLGDKYKNRGLCNIGISFFAIVGFSMLIGGKTAGVQYAGTFLGAIGIYPCIANTVSWTANNTEGVYKRGISMAFVIGFGNLTGVMSSNIYQATDAPRFILGHSLVLAWLVVFLLGGSILQYYLLRRENRLRDEGKRDIWAEGMTPKEAAKVLGDERPDFRYTL